MLEGLWPVSMKIVLSIKMVLSSLALFFSTQTLLKTGGHVLTLKIGNG
jgi:hypothetical protein